MDICFQNVPGQITSRQFEATVSKPLKECGVEDFHCQLIRNKNIAFVTVLDRSAGQRFISLYGVQYRGAQPKNHIICHGQRLRCQRGRHEPTAFDLKALEFQASQRLAKVVVTVPQDDKKTRRFNITHLHCGMWDYNSDSQLQYEAHFTKSSAGTITFGLREAIVLLGDVGTDQLRMDFTYYSCENVVLGDPRTPDVTFTLHHSPRFYQVAGEDVLEAAFRAMNLGTAAGRERSIHKERILGLGSDHLSVAGACKVYRLRLSEPSALLKVQDLLKSHPKMPLSYSLPTHVSFSSPPFKKSYMLLCNQLTDTAKHGKLPFQLRFQLDRLARNGYLSPLIVLNLLPTVHTLWAEVGADPVALALRKLARSLPLPGPENCDEYSTAWLDSQLRSFVDLYDYHAPDNPYEIARRHQHINLIHRVVITPTSVRLEGPDPEPTNRVLRQYADSTDHFIRVIFTDEDGGSVRYDPRASQRAIYDKRFYGELRKSIIIAGRGFDFLGFSHSALRGHSCWAMAPIAYKGTFHYAPNVLKALGDFEHIRTPAKCAARIGQNFTDTNDTIELKPSNVGELALVTRNGYDFSDGVGTVSQELLSKVWRVYGTKRLLKPTALQIRFQGAKGMVSLDSRVRGEQLLLRSNMKKFETSSSWNLEVCGAAFKPLPMFLNRQLIKLLEDLEVPSQVFFDLQDAAMQRLRFMTESSINTGLFLRQSVSQATHISSLMWHLGEIGLDYHCDLFLRRVVEMAVVTELRDLKYRGRIPVKDGMTLYGIMDETGYLQEGEVFVVTEQQGTPAAAVSFLNGVNQVPNGKQVLVQNNVVITRSPAMHPGDVQLVNAVRVPEDSPLQHLRNVVVFSQHGRRDLPSQLSGGDLDGDLYNVICDRRLRPAYTHDAAEYPRLPRAELKRPVIADDMIKHMLLFMETDQLGMISNVHLQLADQKELDTNDPDCVKIAKMASIAVDFSKTGIAVDMSQLPRYNRLRPDFMAPNPRLFISGSGKLELEDPVEGEDEAFEGIDEERKPMRYYRSEKVLGHLYRNIDENKFLADLQQQHYAHSKGAGLSPDLRETLCEYVLHHANMYSVLYENYMDLARDIRAGYEDSLLDILYQYSPTSHGPITETEAYAGTILGRQGGAQGKPLRDLNKAMRERFEPVAEYATMRIINGDAAMQEAEYLDDLYDIQEREIEAWPRAIACVVVACREKGLEDRRLGELKSFAYIALAVCLKEFERTRMGLGRHGTLPELSA